jgi:hypothetical protein
MAAPITVASGISPDSAPKEVATPFPPRNFNQIGKECPITADIAAKTPTTSGEVDSGRVAIAIAIVILTAPKPFKKSKTKTG